MPPSSAAHWEALWHKAANAEILVALAQKRALFQWLYGKVNKIKKISKYRRNLSVFMLEYWMKEVHKREPVGKNIKGECPK